jgi:hypothetical protein
MPNNLSEQVREWDEQAVQCARQADTQTDPKGETAVFGTQAALAVVGAQLRL